MELTRTERILLSRLSKHSKARYTVVDYCRDAKIHRGNFYNHYHDICDLFVSVIRLRLRRTLRSSDGETIGQMFYRMLVKIRENKIFYMNILLITKNPRAFYDDLKKELAQAIENYLRPRGAFSVRQVQLVAMGIYAVVYNWLVHECKHDIRDVYQCIDLLLT
ncbi:hypothetical protein EQ500_03130, partial [Lactobacillus sp. XV13L]|nr:hypothetical protein [Lactobacillus sp. XV13L]